MSFFHSACINSFKNIAITLTVTIVLASHWHIAQANPASDRAFGDCVTAAAAYLETRGHQVGSVTVLARDSDQHRMRITPAAADAEPAAIICTASRQTTSIEAIPAHLALTNAAR
jgi:hypothetical protein